MFEVYKVSYIGDIKSFEQSEKMDCTRKTNAELYQAMQKRKDNIRVKPPIGVKP